MISWYALTPCSLASHRARGGSFVGFLPNPSRRVAIGPFHWSNYWPPVSFMPKNANSGTTSLGRDLKSETSKNWLTTEKSTSWSHFFLDLTIFHHISWYINNEIYTYTSFYTYILFLYLVPQEPQKKSGTSDKKHTSLLAPVLRL